jgi:hypothetical protein
MRVVVVAQVTLGVLVLVQEALEVVVLADIVVMA